MKRVHFLWCIVPLGLVLFHFGLGERWLYAETAVRIQLQGFAAEASDQILTARELYLNAEKAAHPDDVLLRARLRIDTARTTILAGAPLNGVKQIERLLGNHADGILPSQLRAEARATRALGLYYAAYALRLDSPEPAVWQPELDSASQLFRDLFEDASREGRAQEAVFYARNLEACVRLKRTRQAELASLPTPPAVLATLNRGVSAKKLPIDEAP